MNVTSHTQPFYGPFSGSTWVSRCQKKSSSGLYGARGDIRGRHTDNLAGCTPTGLVSDQPPPSPFLCQMSILLQPSHFILVWDRHQICWLAQPVAWFNECCINVTQNTRLVTVTMLDSTNNGQCKQNQQMHNTQAHRLNSRNKSQNKYQ